MLTTLTTPSSSSRHRGARSSRLLIPKETCGLRRSVTPPATCSVSGRKAPAEPTLGDVPGIAHLRALSGNGSRCALCRWVGIATERCKTRLWRDTVRSSRSACLHPQFGSNTHPHVQHLHRCRGKIKTLDREQLLESPQVAPSTNFDL